MLTVTTKVHLTSTSLKLMLQDYTSSYLVIPSTIEGKFDCSCSISAIIPPDQNCSNLINSCHCMSQTAFKNTTSGLTLCKSYVKEYPFILQISNITSEINCTRLHIYKGYDRCKMCQDALPCNTKYREYVKAFLILHGEWNVSCSSLCTCIYYNIRTWTFQ